MDYDAVFIEKLYKALEKIHVRSVEEIDQDLRNETPDSEQEDSDTSFVEIPNLDHGKAKESAAESSVLACRMANAAEGFEDLVVVSKVTELERVQSYDGKKIQTTPPTDCAEDSKGTDCPPPAKVPKNNADFDAEKRKKHSELYTKKSRSPNSKEDDSEGECSSEEDEDPCLDSDTEDELEKEELVTLLLPEEKEELNLISETTKLHNKLIDTRKNELYSKLKKEAEAHCRSIKQKAVNEILIFKRSSSVVVKEYQRAVLMVMKYLDIQLKKVNDYENSALEFVIDDFNKNEREVFDKVRERKQLYLETKHYRNKRKASYIHNPFLFYITFVIVLTIYSAFAVRLINMSKL